MNADSDDDWTTISTENSSGDKPAAKRTKTEEAESPTKVIVPPVIAAVKPPVIKDSVIKPAVPHTEQRVTQEQSPTKSAEKQVPSTSFASGARQSSPRRDRSLSKGTGKPLTDAAKRYLARALENDLKKRNLMPSYGTAKLATMLQEQLIDQHILSRVDFPKKPIVPERPTLQALRKSRTVYHSVK